MVRCVFVSSWVFFFFFWASLLLTPVRDQDHLAVSLFLQKYNEGTQLELFLPCSLDLTHNPPQFEDTGVRDWRKNPGHSANLYHSKFSKALGYDSILDIQKAVSLGAQLNTEHFGFFRRNAQVAKADHILAFTWSTDEPEGGGTKHTWNLCTGERFHIALASIDVSQDS